MERRRKIEEDIDTLESLVLGDGEDLISRLEAKDELKVNKPKRCSVKKQRKSLVKKRKVAWVDDEEQNIKLIDAIKSFDKKPTHNLELYSGNVSYKEHLIQRYASVFETPNWAKLDNKVNFKVDGELLDGTHAGDFLDKTKSLQLPSGRIDVSRCNDLNAASRAEGSVIRSVEFHPGASIAVAAGLNGIASLFQVDGKNNPKIQSVVFKKFPISVAHFSTNGEELIVGSDNYRFFYYYDMLAGQTVKINAFQDMDQKNVESFEVSPDGNLLAFLGSYGYIHLVTAKTKEWIGSLKMNGYVKSLAFSKDGSYLYSFGDPGEVFVWDMKTRDCIHKFTDEGSIHGTSIAISPNNEYLTCGSDSGIVNIYDVSTILSSSSPKPRKVLYNMTTSVDGAKFNHNSEILMLSSQRKENTMKLVHFPSMTVFSNFPTDQLNMKRVNAFDISVNSGFFTVSSNTGTAYLYRLKHYENF